MDLLALFQADAERHQAEIRDEISGMDEHALALWCREKILERSDLRVHLKPEALNALDPVTQIKNCGRGDASLEEDRRAVLELAKEVPVWRDALLNVARELRQKKKPIPDLWHDYVLDLALGVEKGPDGRGLANLRARNEAICWCIWILGTMTKFRPTRTAGSAKPCGASIVAEAIGDQELTYGSVKQIWVHRDKAVFPNPKTLP